MVWYWTSYWENGAGSWADFMSRSSTSKVAWRDRVKAERAANAFSRRTGYPTNVRKCDGRKWRGKIR